MLAKVILCLCGIVISLCASADSDLGDVLVCESKNPIARFAIGQSFNSDLGLNDHLTKLRAVSPSLSSKLQNDVQAVQESIKWTNSKFKNLDGDVLSGCELQQLYQRNTTMGGKPFFVINQNLFQSLSKSEQSLFLIEMALHLRHEKIDDRMNILAILKVEGAILNSQPLTRLDWLKITPKTWISDTTAPFEKCFIPTEYFNTLFCPHQTFNIESETGSMLLYDNNQAIELLGEKYTPSQVQFIDGQVRSLSWSLMLEHPERIGASTIYPWMMVLPDANSDLQMRINHLKTSTIICANQRLAITSGVIRLGDNGCLTYVFGTQLVYGEARARDGKWYSLDAFSKFDFDSEGYLVN